MKILAKSVLIVLSGMSLTAWADNAPQAPTIAVDTSIPITQNSANVKLTVTDGTTQICGLEVTSDPNTWPSTPDYQDYSACQDPQTGTPFDVPITGLQPGTTYYVRAFGGVQDLINPGTYDWSTTPSETSFQTQSSVSITTPTIQVTPSGTSVSINFTNIPNNANECAVEYKLQGQGNNAYSPPQQNGTCLPNHVLSGGTASMMITGLQENQTYDIVGFAGVNTGAGQDSWSNPTPAAMATTSNDITPTSLELVAPTEYEFANGNEVAPYMAVLLNAAGEIIDPASDPNDYNAIRMVDATAANVPLSMTSPDSNGFFIEAEANIAGSANVFSSPYQSFYANGTGTSPEAQSMGQRTTSNPNTGGLGGFPTFYISNNANAPEEANIEAQYIPPAGGNPITSSLVSSGDDIFALKPIQLEFTDNNNEIFPVGSTITSGGGNGGGNNNQNINLYWQNDVLFIQFDFMENGININDNLAPIGNATYQVQYTPPGSSSPTIIPSKDLFLASPTTLGIRWNNLSSHAGIKAGGTLQFLVHDVYGNAYSSLSGGGSASLNLNATFPTSERFCGTGDNQGDCVDVFVSQTTGISGSVTVDIQPRAPYSSFSTSSYLGEYYYPGPQTIGPWRIDTETDVAFTDGYTLKIPLNVQAICDLNSEPYAMITADPTLPTAMPGNTCDDWSANSSQ